MRHFEFDDIFDFFGNDFFEENENVVHLRHCVKLMYLRKRAEKEKFKEDNNEESIDEDAKEKDGLYYEIYGSGEGLEGIHNIQFWDKKKEVDYENKDEWEEIENDSNEHQDKNNKENKDKGEGTFKENDETNGNKDQNDKTNAKEDEQSSKEYQTESKTKYEKKKKGKNKKKNKNKSKDESVEEVEFEEIEDDHFEIFLITNTKEGLNDKFTCNFCKDKKLSYDNIKKHFIKTHQKEYELSSHNKEVTWKKAIEINKKNEEKMAKEFFGMGVDEDDFDFDKIFGGGKKKGSKNMMNDIEMMMMDMMLNPSGMGNSGGSKRKKKNNK
jgi:hypothetical protein